MSLAYANEYDPEVYARPPRKKYISSLHDEDATLSASGIQKMTKSMAAFSDQSLLQANPVQQVWLPGSILGVPLDYTMTTFVKYEVGTSLLSQKNEIQNLIEKFVGDNSVFAPNTISPHVADTAKKLLSLIPLNKQLPKVDADGEGAMLFLWSHGRKHFLVIVEADRLHLVINAATPAADYVSDIIFDGTSLPEQLIDHVPE